MAYDDNELERDRKQRIRKKDKPPLQTPEDRERRRRLEDDLQELIETVEDSDYFAREVERLTARCGLHMGREQRERVLGLWDAHWRRRRTP